MKAATDYWKDWWDKEAARSGSDYTLNRGTTLRLEEDWEYDSRVGALGVPLAFVDDVMGEHRDHPVGRLSRGASDDAARLADRAAAHALIYAHARRAGVRDDEPAMRHFARELFLLARQCGAAGLARQSRELFELSREASGDGAAALQFRLYRAAAALVGWRGAGKLSCMADRLR